MFLSSSMFEEYRSLRELANRELGINTVQSGLHLASHTCTCPSSASGATQLCLGGHTLSYLHPHARFNPTHHSRRVPQSNQLSICMLYNFCHEVM